jgi:hypothetical protein
MKLLHQILHNQPFVSIGTSPAPAASVCHISSSKAQSETFKDIIAESIVQPTVCSVFCISGNTVSFFAYSSVFSKLILCKGIVEDRVEPFTISFQIKFYSLYSCLPRRMEYFPLGLLVRSGSP